MKDVFSFDFPADFPGVNVGLGLLVPSGKWEICDVISQEIETVAPHNLSGRLKLPLLLSVQNLNFD